MNNMNKKTFLITILSLAFVLTMLGHVLAASAQAPSDSNVVNLENPIGVGRQGTTSAAGIISVVIKGALGIIGALTLLMFVWGGFEWLTSAGNPEKVKSGMQTMLWAVIGVVLVFASYLLLATFTNILTTGKP